MLFQGNYVLLHLNHLRTCANLELTCTWFCMRGATHVVIQPWILDNPNYGLHSQMSFASISIASLALGMITDYTLLPIN